MVQKLVMHFHACRMLGSIFFSKWQSKVQLIAFHIIIHSLDGKNNCSLELSYTRSDASWCSVSQNFPLFNSLSFISTNLCSILSSWNAFLVITSTWLLMAFWYAHPFPDCWMVLYSGFCMVVLYSSLVKGSLTQLSETRGRGSIFYQLYSQLSVSLCVWDRILLFN